MGYDHISIYKMKLDSVYWALGAVKDMSKEMWSNFVEECKCIHRGASQALCQGVHGLQELATHNTRPMKP